MYSKYTGVILKKYPLGEADELLTIYTRERGKLRVKAVSSRKIQSRLGGYLQSLNEIEFETAASGHALPVLISARARTINNFLRGDLRKFAYALVGVETLYRLTADHQENQMVYEKLVKFLQDLGSAKTRENILARKFQLQMLAIMGFGFDIKEEALTREERLMLDALLAGGEIQSLPLRIEQVIEGFLQEVLEREIKSSNVLNSLI